ncbi:MAG TPA: S16 family serine protease [Actinomycetota bacterium]
MLVPLATLALVLYFIRLPYFVLSPGPAEDVEPLIHLTGPGTYPSHGRLLLTAIEFRSTNIYGLVRGWADPTESVVPQADILGPGQSEAQEARVAISEMDTSKIDAAVVALSRFAGYPRRHRPGALVEEVFPNTPAEGELFAGDLVTAVDGTPVHGPEDLGMRIRRAGPGTPLHLTVQGRPGGVTHVTVAPAVIRVQGTDHVVIGVVLVRNFPFPLTIESGEIGGPSAGLMWTLGLIDLLTPGDLTRGRTIAGTGAIDLRGRVYPIGGVEEKVVAAERAGARIFFAPVQDAPAARRVAHGITVVPVRTYLDALAYLLNRPPLPPRARTNSLG